MKSLSLYKNKTNTKKKMDREKKERKYQNIIRNLTIKITTTITIESWAFDERNKKKRNRTTKQNSTKLL